MRAVGPNSAGDTRAPSRAQPPPSQNGLEFVARQIQMRARLTDDSNWSRMSRGRNLVGREIEGICQEAPGAKLKPRLEEGGPSLTSARAHGTRSWLASRAAFPRRLGAPLVICSSLSLSFPLPLPRPIGLCVWSTERAALARSSSLSLSSRFQRKQVAD